ncbi:MAG: helix-turn-helix domain-containing protein [Gammaproteobacteria bacterium]|nr:helix-turn-helix domain-containing protein [Gammaproteobacteria bacterium]MBU0821863.1 helix-turn-helix domain-containing protein [Gammaproteobacteria bacterium]MBU0843976.1 helix-turn-helix domain-containing protein [Gammaproteobacteria bacterium]MBU1842227.1 helix-turn-helix domain-containing protein [Gammaproteobacteria bacterium]
MKTERRALENWEADECSALKAELAEYNKRVPKAKRLTQEEIADRLGMSQGTLSSHLNGKRAINMAMASKMAKMLDIEVEKFSPRLAQEISEISESHIVGGVARNLRVSSELTGGVDKIIRSMAEKAIERVRDLVIQDPNISGNGVKKLLDAEVQESITGLLAEIVRAADSGDIADEQIKALRSLIGAKRQKIE